MSIPNQVLLLVEDCPDDVFFMRYALKQAAITCPTHVVTDGQQAIDYLSGLGQYSDRSAFPLPTAIFLDLKLPFLNGFDVLSWLRNQPSLSQLPVIILTGSSESRDKEQARALGVLDYYVKPATPSMLRAVMESLNHVPARAPLDASRF
jgi:CheY-like chemotaxis protein